MSKNLVISIKNSLLCIAVVIGFAIGTEATQEPGLTNYQVFTPGICDSMAHPVWAGHSIYFFGLHRDTPRPTTIFLHGINAPDPAAYGGLINHIVDKGWNIVYTPYNTGIAMMNPAETYESLWKSAMYACTMWRRGIDTSRIGVVGHSYGGGASPYIAKMLFCNNKWGNRSSFIFTMAPWFSWNMTNEQLQTLPLNTLLFTQIYADDHINDFRMAIDIYNHFGTQLEKKRFSNVSHTSDTGKQIIIPHESPNGGGDRLEGTNCIDSLAIYPAFDLVSDYALLSKVFPCDTNKDLLEVCSFSPINKSIQTGFTASCSVRPPLLTIPQGNFVNFWDHLMNPRVSMVHGRNTHIGTLVTISNFFNMLRKKASFADANSETDSGGIEMRWLWDPSTGDKKVCTFIKLSSHPMPLFVFIPPLIGTTISDYKPFLLAQAERGYAVFYCTGTAISTDPLSGGANRLIGSIENACEILAEVIDTSKIVLYTHGTGSGNIPTLADHFFGVRKWGVRKADIWAAAPGSCTNKAQTNLSCTIRLFHWLFSDSWKNDWRFSLHYDKALNILKENSYWILSDLVDSAVHKNSYANPRTAPQGVVESVAFKTNLAEDLFISCDSLRDDLNADILLYTKTGRNLVTSKISKKPVSLSRQSNEYFGR